MSIFKLIATFAILSGCTQPSPETTNSTSLPIAEVEPAPDELPPETTVAKSAQEIYTEAVLLELGGHGFTAAEIAAIESHVKAQLALGLLHRAFNLLSGTTESDDNILSSVMAAVTIAIQAVVADEAKMASGVGASIGALVTVALKQDAAVDSQSAATTLTLKLASKSQENLPQTPSTLAAVMMSVLPVAGRDNHPLMLGLASVLSEQLIEIGTNLDNRIDLAEQIAKKSVAEDEGILEKIFAGMTAGVKDQDDEGASAFIAKAARAAGRAMNDLGQGGPDLAAAINATMTGITSVRPAALSVTVAAYAAVSVAQFSAALESMEDFVVFDNVRTRDDTFAAVVSDAASNNDILDGAFNTFWRHAASTAVPTDAFVDKMIQAASANPQSMGELAAGLINVQVSTDMEAKTDLAFRTIVAALEGGADAMTGISSVTEAFAQKLGSDVNSVTVSQAAVAAVVATATSSISSQLAASAIAGLARAGDGQDDVDMEEFFKRFEVDNETLTLATAVISNDRGPESATQVAAAAIRAVIGTGGNATVAANIVAAVVATNQGMTDTTAADQKEAIIAAVEESIAIDLTTIATGANACELAGGTYNPSTQDCAMPDYATSQSTTYEQVAVAEPTPSPSPSPANDQEAAAGDYTTTDF